MKGHGQKLSHKQEALISALLTTPTLVAAAKAAGLAEATVWRWLKDPTFQQSYRAAKRQLVDHAVTQLQRASSIAVLVLRTIMLDRAASASARVTAARTVLDLAMRGVEIESLEERIAALEAAPQETGGTR